MDWPREQWEFSEHDFTVFRFNEVPSLAVRRLTTCDEDVGLRVERLGSTAEYNEWLDAVDDDSQEPGFWILLGGRKVGGYIPGEKVAPLHHLPFPESAFRRLVRLFRVHPVVGRAVLRQVSYFSPAKVHDGINFTARMSAFLPGDLALSSTYCFSTKTVFAIFYGCNDDQEQKILDRIRQAGHSLKHPLMPAGIFAELERDRLVDRAEKLLDEFVLGSDMLETKPETMNGAFETGRIQKHLGLCLESRNLADQIRAVKRQLVKLTAQIDDVEQKWFQRRDTFISAKERDFQLSLRETGLRMKGRLRDIMDEYDDKIDECNTMMSNMSFTMQCIWSQFANEGSKTSNEIAKMNSIVALQTKLDSVQMRSIAVLTMIYLPISTVASIFSMTLFTWEATEGSPVVSRYIWVYIVLAAGFTVLTVLTWHISTRRERQEAKATLGKFI